MARKVLFLFLYSLILSGSAQSIYYARRNGELPSGYDLNKVNDSISTKRILKPKTNNRLSATQSFAFPFLFNGKYYTNYKVSDNGYITFNTSDTVSRTPDSLYSNIADITNSLAPFWHDLELKRLPYPNQEFNVKVFTYTTGKFPNRKHIIQYYGLSQASDTLSASITNADVFAFAVVLYEGTKGQFDFIYNYFGKTSVKGMVGAVNRDGQGYFVKNAPIGFPMAVSSALINTSIFRFTPGEQPLHQLYIREAIIKPEYLVNESVPISCKITNLGSDTLTYFHYYYIINQKDTIRDTIDLAIKNLRLLPCGENTLTITHRTQWVSGIAGSINQITVLALSPQDTFNSDSTVFAKKTRSLRILGITPISRNVMLEVSTGGWCGYCPNAHLFAEDNAALLKSKLIPITHHFGDPMQTEQSNIVNETYERGYPYGVFDRKFFTGQIPGWENILNIQKKDSSIVKLTIINRNYNSTTREITYTIKAKFYDYLLGNYRIGAILTENNVRGYVSPSQWSQNNYFSKDYLGGLGGPTHPMYYEEHYMDGYLHQFVVLDMPHSAWGKDSSLPEYIKPGDEFTLNVSYILPETETVEYAIKNKSKYCNTKDSAGQNESRYKPDDVFLIGFVAEYQSDIYKRSILNAGISHLFNDFTSDVHTTPLSDISVYPNPGNGRFTIRYPYNNKANTHLTISNALGQQIMSTDDTSGNSELSITTAGWPAGIYILSLTNNGLVFTRKFVITE
ncbi:MAG: T9SS type A sorting domain-containing protein [Bacteroidota bacterium]